MMRKLCRTLLRILDGSPGAYGARQRGQSLLELAFITPLLFMLILGTVEVGWFANHVLILLEVTRVGARSGTVLTGELSPLSWNNAATIHPIIYTLENGYSFMADGNFLTYAGTTGLSRYAGTKDPTGTRTECSGGNCTTITSYAWDTARRYRNCEGLGGTDVGFYNYITCAMLDSLDPLTLRQSPGDVDQIGWKSISQLRTTETVKYIPPDDMIISGFSIQVINNTDTLCAPGPGCLLDNTTYARSTDLDAFAAASGLYAPGFQAVVVGRYPVDANECNVAVTPATTLDEPFITTVMYPLAERMDEIETGAVTDRRVQSPVSATYRLLNRRDPFDYIPDNALSKLFNGREIEIAGMDNRPEFQRGFVLTGQHVVKEPDEGLVLNAGEELFCIGSEFSDEEVVRLMNLPGFLSKTADLTERQIQTSLLPSQGLVLVEMYWHHTTLLNFPFLTTLVQIFGDTQRIEISAWAAFPLPSLEPNIVFQLPPED